MGVQKPNDNEKKLSCSLAVCVLKLLYLPAQGERGEQGITGWEGTLMMLAAFLRQPSVDVVNKATTLPLHHCGVTV